MPVSGTPERRRAYFREWYAKNRDRCIAAAKRRYQANKKDLLARSRIRYHGRYRDSKLARIYGITKTEARKWLAIRVCEICGATDRRLTLDHDHARKRGHVRGRLCTNCNSGLGHFKDNPDTLEAAARYIRERLEKES